jgi:ubiquitin C-terminal hydrolase
MKGCGLANVGYTCYINACIQCLFHDSEFVEFIMDQAARTEHAIDRPLTCVIASVAKMYALGVVPSAALRELKATMRCIMGNVLDFSRENDMQELMILIIDSINKECKCAHPPVSALIRPTFEDKAWIKAHQNEYSELVPMYHGQLVRTIECSVCKKQHINVETFLTLPIDLPQADEKKTTLEEVVTRFLQGTVINRWKCDGCGSVHESITQTLRITRMPRTLVFTLNRFTSGLFKNAIPVSIPEGVAIGNNVTYALFSVGCHIGSYDHGHYFAICNDVQSGSKWQVIDDDEIKETTDMKMISPSAVYLVLYKVVETKRAH